MNQPTTVAAPAAPTTQAGAPLPGVPAPTSERIVRIPEIAVRLALEESALRRLLRCPTRRRALGIDRYIFRFGRSIVSTPSRITRFIDALAASDPRSGGVMPCGRCKDKASVAPARARGHRDIEKPTTHRAGRARTFLAEVNS